ncbi:hypothetical protein PSm6_26110 [Pseudomonas solani]|uniref:DUF2388 domain-containing protein n=1 Tax=Pseudomonas solani TaxID=2731552 RepID=A0ABM7L9I2_9PSED|nr:DUF2388 domain-containing protein [Pseudomonas solani]BCD86204.1 hypothetical protein PSm6_26110 [Pseudomonas solani]
MRPTLSLCLALLALPAAALADEGSGSWLLSSSAAITFAPATTSNLSQEERQPGIQAQARDDAMAFVASDGRIRGAQLERTLQELHRQPATASADDMSLARALAASAYR